MHKVEFLGKARIWHDDTWQPIPADKRGALLLYLAVQGNWVTRDELTFVFWPDTNTKTAKANLRQILRRTKLLPFAVTLESEGQQIRWRVETNLDTFQKAIKANDWVSASEIYNGHLAQDFAIPDAAGFMAWLDLERSELEHTWQQAITHCSELLAQTDRHAQAATLIKKVWRLNSFDETLLQSYMKQATLAGNSDTALKVYKEFKKLLESDLQLEPLEDTQHLAEQIKLGDFSSEEIPLTTTSNTLELASNTTFLGREKNLAELKAALISEQRLFALLGLGGVGKSRLAIEVGQAVITEFEHGVVFVPLASSTPDTIISTIAKALSFSFYGQQDPKLQLFDYLRNKHMLLILDNFEHLTEHVTSIVELANEAPKLNILFTSREKPDIPKLWIQQLQGLDYDEANSAALNLFLNAAKVQVPSFSATDNDLEVIQKLCELVEGLPLALELAAAWVTKLSTQEILDEIKNNLNTLQNGDNSIEAVLEHSWSLLSPEQQTTLAILSVFRGGFTKLAAQEVTNTSNYILLSLLNRSLIKNQVKRYDLHEMVRQFAAHKLNQLGNSEIAFQNHANFYIHKLTKIDLNNSQRKQVIDLIHQDFDNIRASWIFHIEHKNEKQVEQSYQQLFSYYHSKSLLQEGSHSFKKAKNAFKKNERLSTKLLLQHYNFEHHLGNWKDISEPIHRILTKQMSKLPLSEQCDFLNLYAWLQSRLGSPDKAEDYFKQSYELSQANEDFNLLKSRSESLNGLGTLLLNKGSYQEAETYYKQSIALHVQLGNEFAEAYLQKNLALVYQRQGHLEKAQKLLDRSLFLHRKYGNLQGEAFTLNVVGVIKHGQGKFEESEKAMKRSLAIHRSIGNRPDIASGLNNLAIIVRDVGKSEQTFPLIEESLAIRKEIGDIRGIGICLTNLGNANQALQDYKKAIHYFEQSVAIHKKLGIKRDEASDYTHIAFCLIELGKSKQAKKMLHKAIKILSEISSTPYLLHAFVGYAYAISATNPSDTIKLLEFVKNQKTALVTTKNKAQDLLDLTKDQLSQTKLNTALSEGAALSINESIGLIASYQQ